MKKGERARAGSNRVDEASAHFNLGLTLTSLADIQKQRAVRKHQTGSALPVLQFKLTYYAVMIGSRRWESMSFEDDEFDLAQQLYNH
jgi:hypothetical protein